MLGFGYFASYVSKKVTNKIVRWSGVIVVVLGIVMINNGLVLTGSGYDMGSIVNPVKAEVGETDDTVIVRSGFQEIRMEVTRNGWDPDVFVLQKDVPVRWIIDGKEITGCNNAIQVPKFGLEFDIDPGENIIEFTPTEEGIIRWSCWMGMIPGTFIVKEEIGNAEEIKDEVEQASQQQVSGSCGGSCGSSTCGAAGGGSCGCGG